MSHALTFPKLRHCLLVGMLALCATPGLLRAQITSVQFNPATIPYNLLSTNGVPISTTVGVPPGSNGKLPTVNSSAGSFNPASSNQFQSAVCFGAVASPSNWQQLTNAANAVLLAGTNAFNYSVAQAMGLPVATNQTVAVIQRQAQLGLPYLASAFSYAFGSVIPPPATDENGVLLTNTTPAAYWQGTPWTGPGQTNTSYYASPNAGVVFASQSGQISITWAVATPAPGGAVYNNSGSTVVPAYTTNGAYAYRLFTATYIVSGVPVKAPQKMYWTEGSFQSLGYPISVPSARVTSVHVVYNSSFPQTVLTNYQDPNYVPPVSATNMFQEVRTLWFDSSEKQIRAYNAQGRVFVELLGNPIAGANASQFLGFEIVDVSQAPTAARVTANLGDQIFPYQDGFEGTSLAPSPIQNSLGTQYYYPPSANYNPLYADQLTTDPTDLQIYWLTTSVGGLQWPNLFVDYNLVWPSDPSQYSYYLRPLVATKDLAAQTAVQLDYYEAPSIDYQDPLDQTRAFLPANDGFYTWLSTSEPAQRALLRFNAGGIVRFERVFSFLGQALLANSLFAGSVVTNLSAWNPANSTLTNFASSFNLPYVTNLTVVVGQSITDPPGEIGSTNGPYGDYWAGWINTNLNNSPLVSSLNTNLGHSYDPLAYVDPFANGFPAANAGAIIPVNAIPGSNLLEVWWFRQNTADPTLGFQPVYWPSVIADYTINWPDPSTNQIVLASNAGSRPLNREQAAGSIYYQNDPTQPGYNPNEEHAQMLGGQAYALRDDLNVTNTANSAQPFGGYSSAPYVLLAYFGDDGRPAMRVFPVVREIPAAGIVFDYVVPAGTQLQAPMPLPLMALPLVPNTNYPNGFTNFDQPPPATSGDLPIGWNSAATNGPFSLYQGFTFQDRKNHFWVYRGVNAGLPPLQAGFYNTNDNTFATNLAMTFAITNQPFTNYIHLSRLLPSLTVGLTNLPAGFNYGEDSTNGLFVYGTPGSAQTNAQTYSGTITISDQGDGSTVSVTMPLTVINAGTVTNLGPLVIISTNQYTGATNTYTGRPPSLASAPQPANSFTMQFYYETQAGFAWPNNPNPPPVGSIVPYLTPANSASDPASSNTPSLNIVYRPVWPELINGQPLPVLARAQTLTTANNGLAAVRGQDSVQVIYQQSIATNAVLNGAAASVVLYDPTSEKKATLAALGGLPASVLADAYNGLEYFPNLPPNLISRVWFDPNGTNLVLTGQFVADAVNGNYVMLNVLRGDDLAAVDGLCSTQDTVNYPLWTNAVAQLTATQYTFWENPAVPGSYVINPNDTVSGLAGDLLAVTNSDTAVDSYALSATGPGQGYVAYVVANGLNPKYAGDPVSIYIARVATNLFAGRLVAVNSAGGSPFSELSTFQHTADVAGNTGNYAYDWRITPTVNGAPPLTDPSTWPTLAPQIIPGPVYILGVTGIQGLIDNEISLRYGYTNISGNVVWSGFVSQFAPGWIKRVTQSIDPIAGQTQNLYNNPATTTASLIALAGSRWTGDVPLNAASLTNNGLIQIYETVLDKGKSLSINAGINLGAANQALLLAAGYLNDLYTTLGNDAWANSLNPTIEIGTDSSTYGNIATSQFVFEGEEPTLLEQNLALLRGRDDSLSPGVDVPPVYNHLWWNYTYGLAAGQVIYALNYNITDQNGDGVVNAADAEIMYPQGHGDAYGHYLTALMNYWELLMNPNFDWVPQSESVSILGATVAVNYQDESKFAASAAALARTGRQAFDLTWRQDYVPGTAGGWSYFASNHVGNFSYVDNNNATQKITRYWGMDHWAARVGRGAYFNWLAGNAILPPKDMNAQDQGIQIVDRTTVQDLQELPATAAALQNDLDNANAGFTPLGLAQNAIPFDINPQQVTGANPQTHFEQIYTRAVQALNNAVVAFDAAQNVTADLRQQQNSLSDLQAAVTAQELAYNDQLIELYGTPYPDDIGAGQTYPQDYTGPDLIHYMYVDDPATNTYGGILPDATTNQTFYVDIQNFPTNFFSSVFNNFDFITPSYAPNYDENTQYIAFNIGPDGFSKPAVWTSERGSVGSIQTAATAVNAAQDKYRMACYDAVQDKQSLDLAMAVFNAENATNALDLSLQQQITDTNKAINTIQAGFNIENQYISSAEANIANTISTLGIGDPVLFIFGLSNGGDEAKAALLPVLLALDGSYVTLSGVDNTDFASAQNQTKNLQNAILDYSQELAVNQNNLNIINGVQNLGQLQNQVQNDLGVINQAQLALNGAQAGYQTLVSQGNRIQQERLTFRQHTAAQVQGYTVANSAFLVFQNEDLERYNTLFNLAQEYAWMAANAYDYETGLLGTSAGQNFLSQIISSCALGVVQNGQPQISGNSTGDPGLANALAEMYGDFEVLKSRLGFNNPDGYSTTVSLRSENYRINSGSSGDFNWQQVLQNGLKPDLLADTDVKQDCLGLDDGSGTPVPGIELCFSTTITDGENLFGQAYGPGDHNFSSSSFATKIFSVGVDLDGYVGMDNPVANSGTGGTTPADPTLDPNGLGATPYVYLIPCGADTMRSPPLGDTSTIRTWNVDDVAIPLPFNIGASDFSDTPFYQASDSLTEPLFAVRKHQAFRPVSTLSDFTTSIYGENALQRTQFTNQRLIGRSVWNSKWKLIIPGKTLLQNPNQGLARFINSVKDIHLYFVTYSYSGN